jgi:tetratricopeptide (TPR) repeat protein
MIFACLVGVGLLLAASPADAQRKKKKKPAPVPVEAPADDQVDPAAAGEPAEMTPEEKKAAAIELFGEGQALAKEQKYTEAIAKFEEAFELLPDPNLQFMIGEAFQLDGTENRDYDKLRKSIESYKKYIELVPEGAGTDKANERVVQLEESVKAEEQRVARLADEEAQAKLDAELAREQEEKERLAKEAQKKTMQLVATGAVLAGVDQQLSGILRMSGGGLLSWEKFALEARLGIDGFLKVDPDQGVSARSFTLLDLGARYGLNYRYVGPFVSGGASFGIFTGKPRERKLKGDNETCAIDPNGNCSFNIDKNIAARLAFGYGFRASDKSTVAFRLEVQGWVFSVDDEQEIGSPAAFSVEKPQTSIAIMAGLEFLRWL